MAENIKPNIFAFYSAIKPVSISPSLGRKMFKINFQKIV